MIQKLQRRQTGIELYGLVPPCSGTVASALQEVTQRQIERLQGQALDHLVALHVPKVICRAAGTLECVLPAWSMAPLAVHAMLSPQRSRNARTDAVQRLV